MGGVAEVVGQVAVVTRPADQHLAGLVGPVGGVGGRHERPVVEAGSFRPVGGGEGLPAGGGDESGEVGDGEPAGGGRDVAVGRDGEHVALGVLFDPAGQVRAGAVDLVAGNPGERDACRGRIGDHCPGEGGFRRELHGIGDFRLRARRAWSRIHAWSGRYSRRSIAARPLVEA